MVVMIVMCPVLRDLFILVALFLFIANVVVLPPSQFPMPDCAGIHAMIRALGFIVTCEFAVQPTLLMLRLIDRFCLGIIEHDAPKSKMISN